jgi:hypothetical protein
MSDQSYRCMVESQITDATAQYKSASLLMVAVNAIFLIIQWYLVSCILLLPFNMKNDAKPKNIKKQRKTRKHK